MLLLCCLLLPLASASASASASVSVSPFFPSPSTPAPASASASASASVLPPPAAPALQPPTAAPLRIVVADPLPRDYETYLTLLALQGVCNREAAAWRHGRGRQGQRAGKMLWLSSEANAPGSSSPVMWPYPKADETWLAYLKEHKVSAAVGHGRTAARSDSSSSWDHL